MELRKGENSSMDACVVSRKGRSGYERHCSWEAESTFSDPISIHPTERHDRPTPSMLFNAFSGNGPVGDACRVPRAIASHQSPDIAVLHACKKATYLVFNEGGKREVVEEVGEVSPYVRVPVLAETLVVEAVYLRNLSRFVVAPKNGDPITVAELERDE